MSQRQLAVLGSAKRHVIGCPFAWYGHADARSPAERWDLPSSVTCTERGKPVWAFFNNMATHEFLLGFGRVGESRSTCFEEQGCPQGQLYLCG